MYKFPGFQVLAKRASLLPGTQRSAGNTTTSRLGWRYSSTRVGNTNHRSVLLVATSGFLLALGLSPSYAGKIYADSEVQLTPKSTETSLGALLRSYAVYTMCSIPALVDHSPRILELASLPGLKWITETFVRITFFDQFVGGDTAQEVIPLLHNLRAANKGALFAYSVEVDKDQMQLGATHKGLAPHERIVNEMIRCIDVAGDFEDNAAGGVTDRTTWVAVKITALIPDAKVLSRLSSYILATSPARSPPIPFPGCPHATDLDIFHEPVKGTNPLSAEDIASLLDLHADLVRICKHGQERGIKVVIDAEHSWYQPALDALTLSLMHQFNKLPSRDKADSSVVQPLVYGTYQAYLRRTPSHLAAAFADAKLHNYALGIKLVRGAYHPHELAAHASRGQSPSISPDNQPPVWTSKSDTDACYNECAAMIVGAIKADIDSRKGQAMSAIPSVGVLFGTHNWNSCKLILDGLVESGLASKRSNSEEGGLVVLGDEVTERLVIGQLYGMSDELTNYLVQKTRSKTPLVIKYVPYGALSEVMPYLSRRAIENKSVLGDGIAANERRRAGAEIRRRLFGSWVGA